jgi:hypothetical protein
MACSREESHIELSMVSWDLKRKGQEKVSVFYLISSTGPAATWSNNEALQTIRRIHELSVAM